MRKLFLFLAIILIALGLFACETPPPGEGTPVVTPDQSTPVVIVVTATPEPTPTPERNWWTLGCLDPEEEDGNMPEEDTVFNPNPCLSGRSQVMVNGEIMERPLLYHLVYNEGQYDKTAYPRIWYENGGFNVNLTQYQGDAGLGLSLIEVPAGQCNQITVRGFSTINPTTDWRETQDNFYASATLHLDDGREIDLGNQRMTRYAVGDDGHGYQEVRGPRQWDWYFYLADTAGSLVIEVTVGAIWGTGNHGSVFRFDAFVVRVADSFAPCEDLVAH